MQAARALFRGARHRREGLDGGNDLAILGFLSELHHSLGSRLGLRRTDERRVRADLFAKGGDFSGERRIRRMTRRELLLFEFEKLEALVVDGVRKRVTLAAGIFEALFVELERVDVGLDADLDRTTRLV